MTDAIRDRILSAVADNPTASKTEIAKIVGGRLQNTLQAVNELIGQGKVKPSVRLGREIRFAPTKPELKRWQRELNQVELLERLRDGIVADLQAERAKRPKAKAHGKLKGQGERFLREIAPVDLHVGKYAWDDETGASYDVEIAERVFAEAVNDIDDRTNSARIEETVLVVGNDLLQTDNIEGTTTSGTYVDTDTRYIRSFRRAFKINRWAIDRLAERSPVRVVVVPGNHDRLTAFQIGHSLESWYHNDQRVTIDNSPKLRKYLRYGVNLLGWTHGSEEKHDDLPLIMATEEPELWAGSLHREWHIGHFHKAKETRYTSGDSFNGVRVKVLPALCGPDAWHYAKGYVGGLPACEGYLWNKERGFAGMVSSNVLPERSSRDSSRKSAA